VSYGLPQLTAWGRDVERKIKSGAALAALDADLDQLARLIASVEAGSGEWLV
jgi:hypothetical protein